MTFTASPDRYRTMFYPHVGRHGLQLPKISLGLWNNFGFDRAFDTQREIVRHAFDRGITHFDLANNYGPPAGSAEAVFGQILAADLAPYRDEIVVSSKAGFTMLDGPYQDGGSRKYMLSSLDASLRRTGLDYLDIFYSHRRDPSTPLEETMGALVTAVTSGKALYVGVSNYSAEDTATAAQLLSEADVPLLIHQPRYNMFDRALEDGLLDVIGDLGIGAVVFSPLAQGLLTNRYLNGIPDGSRVAAGRWLSEQNIDAAYLERARALNEIGKRRGQSLAQLAIQWVLRDRRVTSALVGASSTHQLDDTLVALEGAPLTDEELALIEPHAVDAGTR